MMWNVMLNAKIHKKNFVYYVQIKYFRIFYSFCSLTNSMNNRSFCLLTIQMNFQFVLFIDKFDELFYHYEINLFDL